MLGRQTKKPTTKNSPHLQTSGLPCKTSGSSPSLAPASKTMASASSSSPSTQMELLETLGDFTSKSNWDSFFTIRGRDDAFEWYADWPSLRSLLLSALPPNPRPSDLQILVPGCGSSRLSEHLYDAGFRSITNVDFSKVAISDMLRRNVRSRPEMRWRVMDITDLQFADEHFDVAIDKGGLDALMEPKHGSELGKKYLREVKRVLKLGGKFVCFTLAESHVVGLLFSKFRFGWKMNIQHVPQKLNKKSSYQTLMFVVSKMKSDTLDTITSSFDSSSLDCSPEQVRPLVRAIERENKRRNDLSLGNDISYSIEDLQLGAKGDLKAVIPCQRCLLLLGEEGESQFRYKAVLLDSRNPSDAFIYHCGVFIVPKIRAHEWLFCSEEGQWIVMENSKSARLIMVFLDSSHDLANMNDIQKDLSPLVKHLEPANNDKEAAIPFLAAGDGIKHRKFIKKVTSATTGSIIVEDVIYDSGEDDISVKPLMNFRRLTFERSQSLVQSEALLIKEDHSENLGGKPNKKGILGSKSKRKGSTRRNDLQTSGDAKIDYSYLASSYHSGILSGFMLIAPALESAASSERTIKTVIIGLGAGLFPMCLRSCLPFLDIEVVELDAVVFEVARTYFGFAEDKQLKVHISDGIKFIQERASSRSLQIKKSKLLQNGYEAAGEAEKKEFSVLIVDADSSDLSSGLSCPPEDFLQECFLLTVKEYLSEDGLFVINLVSRSPAVRETVILRMKKVFGHLFYLELEEDVNDIIFVLPGESSISVDCFEEMAAKVRDMLIFTESKRRDNIMETAMEIKHLQ